MPRSRKPGLTPEQLLADFSPDVQRLAAELRRIVTSAVPAATERAYPGWRGIGYRDEQAGYFCGIFPLADRVRLLFECGASLDDPEGLFTGGGTRTRHVDLFPGDPLPEAGIRRLIDSAVLYGVVR